MINPKLFNVILAAATEEAKDNVLRELINNISRNYDYNDAKANHLLEMLIDSKEIISPSKINLDYIEKHSNLVTYNPEKYNIRHLTIETVDNIDCVVVIQYEYIEKINEDKADVSYIKSRASISFIEYPEILK